MKQSTLEPGLLWILRLFAVTSLLGYPFIRRLIGQRLGIPLPVDQFLLLSGCIPLLAFLLIWLPWGQRQLGPAFLPVILTLLATHTIGEKFVTIWSIAPAWHELATLFMMVRLWLVFQMMTLIVAWQYSIFWVVAMSIGLSLVDTALSFPFFRPGSVLFPLFYTVVLGRLTTTTAVSLAVAWLMREQRGQRLALAEANQKLARYAATMEQLAASQERNRLARELHDTLAHSLSGVTVQLEAVQALWDVDVSAARQMLTQAMGSARSGLTEARRALQALRASPLEDLGLALAVAHLAQSVAARANLQLHQDIASHLEQLSPEVEQCVYRIAQEALTNVVRHAAARAVWVTLACDNGRLTLTISDDGRGFAPGEVGSGRFGLRGLHERAELVGGRIEVESGPQQGTTVRLNVALGV